MRHRNDIYIVVVSSYICIFMQSLNPGADPEAFSALICATLVIALTFCLAIYKFSINQTAQNEQS